jgi:hypothetical protein
MALVIDPRTGQLVQVPDNNYAAIAQGNAQNPVTGPRGVLPLPPQTQQAPLAPVDLSNLPPGSRAARMQAQLNMPVTAVQPPAAPEQPDVMGDFVSGVNKASLGAVGSLVAAPASILRRGVVGALGGDTAQLGAPLTDQTFGLVNEGLTQAGGAARAFGEGARTGLLSLFGAQDGAPVAPAAPPAVAAPVAAPVVAPAAPAPAPAIRPALTAADLAPTNATIQGLINQSRNQGAQGVTGNSFNATNTATRAPSSNNGINFGFGANGAETASGYLQRMAAQDNQKVVQNQLAQQASMAQLERGSIVAHLNDPFTTPFQRRTLMAQLQLNDTDVQQTRGAVNGLAVAGVEGQQKAAIASAQGQQALQKALLDYQGQIGAASINAQGGIDKASVTADATLGAAGITARGRAVAGAGANQLAATQTQSLLAIQQLTDQWGRTTDPAEKARLAGQIGLLKASQVSEGKQAVDLNTGLFIPPEVQEIGGKNLLLSAQRQYMRALQNQ